MLHENDMRTYINTYPEDDIWKREARAGRLIEAIKIVRADSGHGLKDAKDIVEFYMNETKKAKPPTVTTMLLANGNTLRVTKTDTEWAVEYIRKPETFSVYDESQLLKVIAKIAAENVPYQGPTA